MSVSLGSLLPNSTDADGGVPPKVHSSLDEPTANEVRALNALIVSLLDHIEEHRRAIFAVESRVNWMQRRLFYRISAVEHLQDYVRNLGALPATERSPLAAAVAAKLSCEPYAKNRERELIEDTARSESSLRRQIDSCMSRGRLSESGKACVAKVLHKMDADKEKSDVWSARSLLGIDALRLMNE